MNYSKRITFVLLIFGVSALALGQQPEPELRSRIEGIVVAAKSGDPLTGVVLLLRAPVGGIGDREYRTTTSPDGRFVIIDIPKGRYLLSASKPGFVNKDYGQKQGNKPGAVLDLTTAQTLRDVVVRLSSGGAISGRVYDQAGQPIEGTGIAAFTRRYKRDGTSFLSQAAATSTNDVGEYRMYWLAPDTYYLFALVLPRNRTAAGPVLEPVVIDQSAEPPDAFVPAFYPNGEDDSQATPIRMEDGADLRALDFTLTRTKALRVKGRIVSGAGQPVADAGIELRLAYFEASRAPRLYAHSDAAGNFEVSNVAPGRYIVSTRWTEPGFRSMFTQQELRIGNKDISDLQIVLQPNRNISGRLITERGEPVPQNRTVLLFTDSDGTSFGTGLQEDGTFLLSNISTGTFHVELTGFPDNFFIRSARTENRDVLWEGLSVADNSVDSLDIVVSSHGATVEGVVTDDNMVPLVAANVVLVPGAERRDRPDLFKTATTDQHGRFTIRGAVPGDYKIFGWDDLEPNIYFDPSFLEKYESRGKAIHLDDDGSATVSIRAN